ncbi:MAG: UDP-N-acetylmuramoyl-L-alanyl-D-glutamate--2,6-diaminopimelate ligase, partial [Flavobacteriaceae bacterium]|nr:UDP-N-acetylmuramoyl-L-alanyl-D-glutamate--2,6-diaminopimelate ligase [Flavobacteriaceae bacterium]
MIVLKDILYKVKLEKVVGNTSVPITNIHFDSRSIRLNDVFVAIRGSISDGHDYIKIACDNGAIAVICEKLPENF